MHDGANLIFVSWGYRPEGSNGGCWLSPLDCGRFLLALVTAGCVALSKNIIKTLTLYPQQLIEI